MGILSKGCTFSNTVNMDEEFHFIGFTFLAGDRSLAAEVEYFRDRNNSWNLLLITS